MIMEQLFNKERIKKLADRWGVKSVNYIDYHIVEVNGEFKETSTYTNLEDLFKMCGDIYLLNGNVYRGFNVL